MCSSDHFNNGTTKTLTSTRTPCSIGLHHRKSNKIKQHPTTTTTNHPSLITIPTIPTTTIYLESLKAVTNNHKTLPHQNIFTPTILPRFIITTPRQTNHHIYSSCNWNIAAKAVRMDLHAWSKMVGFDNKRYQDDGPIHTTVHC